MKDGGAEDVWGGKQYRDVVERVLVWERAQVYVKNDKTEWVTYGKHWIQGNGKGGKNERLDA